METPSVSCLVRLMSISDVLEESHNNSITLVACTGWYW